MNIFKHTKIHVLDVLLDGAKFGVNKTEKGVI